MTSTPERSQLRLRGLERRRGARGAVVALNGARVAELRRAEAVAGGLSDRILRVAVDGGLATWRRTGRRPDLYVGDLDSARRPPAGIDTRVLSRDKDQSDLSAALEEMCSRKVQVVAVAGLLGGRLDHEWGNLFELGAHAGAFAGIVAPTDRGTVVVTGAGCRIVTVPGKTVSLFALGGAAVVTLDGTRWTLSRRRVRPGSHGLSNLTGTELDLTVHGGAVCLVLDLPKRAYTRASR